VVPVVGSEPLELEREEAHWQGPQGVETAVANLGAKRAKTIRQKGSRMQASAVPYFAGSAKAGIQTMEQKCFGYTASAVVVAAG